MKAILGVDIAKKSFDVTLVMPDGEKERRQFKNKLSGFKALEKWRRGYSADPMEVCMEATSIYWEELAHYLYEAGHKVSVVNPVRIKGYARSQLRRSKTDPLDADIIADFCRTQRPNSWRPPTAEQRKLRALVRHVETLKKSRTQQRNRLAVCTDAEVQASLELLLTTIDSEIARLQKRIDDFIDNSPDLKEKQRLLCSIKGIGKQTTTRLMAEMYDLEHYKNAKAAAADAGVTASHFTSGTTVRRRSKISRLGKASVRGALYFPAISAIRFNPAVQRMVHRLQAKGKHKSVIIVAAMRKLLHIAYGVLKHRKPFDPDYEVATT